MRIQYIIYFVRQSDSHATKCNNLKDKNTWERFRGFFSNKSNFKFNQSPCLYFHPLFYFCFATCLKVKGLKNEPFEQLLWLLLLFVWESWNILNWWQNFAQVLRQCEKFAICDNKVYCVHTFPHFTFLTRVIYIILAARPLGAFFGRRIFFTGVISLKGWRCPPLKIVINLSLSYKKLHCKGEPYLFSK